MSASCWIRIITVPTALAGALTFVQPALAEETNPLLAPWTGPFGGVPPFDQVRVADFQPALEAAMAACRAEVSTIAAVQDPPTFANTILAYERSCATLDRVRTLYGTWGSSRNDQAFRRIERLMEPRLAALQDEITQNKALFSRIDAVARSPELASLPAEDQRLVWLHRTRFIKNGARLNAAQKARVARLNQQLSGLYTRFSQNQLADEEGRSLVVRQVADLDGLPAAQVHAAAEEGARRGHPGTWVFANTRSAIEPLLTYARQRALRERAFRMWTRRGDNGDAHDNKAIVSRILALRAERSRLMGFPTFAHWRLTDTMARTPERAMDLMMQVWRPAVAQVRADVARMQALIDADHGGFKLAPWDYRYYAEKVRQADYALDVNDLNRYLQLDRVRDAMFRTAEQLYGLHFVPVQGVPVFDPAMSVYEVRDRDDQHVGLWYFDPYARAGKQSGAWMSGYRAQQRLDKLTTTLVSNNSNFIPAPPGQPVLISWDDAITMFHEFGHALHGLNTSVTYASLSGANSSLDFIEFPSQLNEHWLSTTEVQKSLTDVDGHAMPDELIDRLKRSQQFNKGFTVVEYLASALIDMQMHLQGSKRVEPRAFERRALAKIGMPSEIVLRHRIPAFGHVFSGEDYAAGYYAYLWAQVLEHDAWEAFAEAGGPFDVEVARRLQKDILSVGNSVDPGEAFRSFRGRDATVDALLRADGFSPASAIANPQP